MYRSIKAATASARPQAHVLLLPAKTKAQDVPACPDPQALEQLLNQADTSLAPEWTRTLYHSESSRTLVVGLGEADKIDADTIRRAAAKALRELNSAKLTSASIQTVGLPDTLDHHKIGRAIADGLSLANFTFDTYHGKTKLPEKSKREKPRDLKIEDEADPPDPQTPVPLLTRHAHTATAIVGSSPAERAHKRPLPPSSTSTHT